MGWANTELTETDVHDFFIVNNIFWNSAIDGSVNLPLPESGGGPLVSIGDYVSGDSIIFDYNCYAGTGSSIVGAHGHYEDFKNETGAQTHEVVTDPMLSSSHIPVSKSSPVVDAGVSLQFLFDYDIAGIFRPQGLKWDMGAYEYPSGTIDTPGAPKNLRVK